MSITFIVSSSSFWLWSFFWPRHGWNLAIFPGGFVKGVSPPLNVESTFTPIINPTKKLSKEWVHLYTYHHHLPHSHLDMSPPPRHYTIYAKMSIILDNFLANLKLIVFFQRWEKRSTLTRCLNSQLETSVRSVGFLLKSIWSWLVRTMKNRNGGEKLNNRKKLIIITMHGDGKGNRHQTHHIWIWLTSSGCP